MISLMGPWCECGVNEASLSSHLLGKPSNVTNVTLFEVWDPPCDCCSMEPSDVNRRVRSRFDISENPQRIPVWHPAKPQCHIDTSLQHAKLEHSSPRFSQILPDRPYAPSLTMKWRNMSATPRGFCGDSWNPIGRPSPIKNHQMVFFELVFIWGNMAKYVFYFLSWIYHVHRVVLPSYFQDEISTEDQHLQCQKGQNQLRILEHGLRFGKHPNLCGTGRLAGWCPWLCLKIGHQKFHELWSIMSIP